MANVYVWSGAAGTANGSSWANAYKTLAAAFAATRTAGDIIFVAHDHTETTAGSIVITIAVALSVYCVYRLGSVPPVEADRRSTAEVKTSAANGITLNCSANGKLVEMNGLNFTAGSGTGTVVFLFGQTAGASPQRYVNCTFKLGATGAGCQFNFGPGGGSPGSQLVIWENCKALFSNAAQVMNFTNGRFVWKNTKAAFGNIGGSNMNAPFVLSTMNNVLLHFEGLDFLPYGSPTGFFASLPNVGSYVTFKDCDLYLSKAVPDALVSSGAELLAIRSNGGGGRNSFNGLFKISNGGRMALDYDQFHTGGANEDGPISWKINTSAGASRAIPFEAPPITFWNEVVLEPIEVAIEAAWSTAGLPTNADCWIDVEYPGDTVNYLGTGISVTTGGKSLLDTPVAYPASAEPWATNPASKFKMAPVWIVPTRAGPITIYPKFGKASVASFWIDPKPVVTPKPVPGPPSGVTLTPNTIPRTATAGAIVGTLTVTNGFPGEPATFEDNWDTDFYVEGDKVIVMQPTLSGPGVQTLTVTVTDLWNNAAQFPVTVTVT